jgi:hypothetical protein
MGVRLESAQIASVTYFSIPDIPPTSIGSPSRPRDTLDTIVGMAVVLSVLGVTFTALAIWLAVRIINRHERWAMWMLAAISVLSIFGWLWQEVPPVPPFVFGGIY